LTFTRHSGIMEREETPMPGLDELTNPNELAEMFHRVITQRQIEVVYDEEGNPAVALIGFEQLMQLMEEANPKIRTLKEQIRKLAQKERERVQALIAQEPERLKRRELPWEAIKADPKWQQRWDTLLAEVRGHAPSALSPEEIDAEIEAAREAIYQDRGARHS
jgi:hypothetical protein